MGVFEDRYSAGLAGERRLMSRLKKDTKATFVEERRACEAASEFRLMSRLGAKKINNDDGLVSRHVSVKSSVTVEVPDGFVLETVVTTTVVTLRRI
jgi:hypothetical protein